MMDVWDVCKCWTVHRRFLDVNFKIELSSLQSSHILRRFTDRYKVSVRLSYIFNYLFFSVSDSIRSYLIMIIGEQRNLPSEFYHYSLSLSWH